MCLRVIVLLGLLLILASCQSSEEPDLPLFQDVSTQAGIHDLNSAWGVAWVDYDQDGWMDLFFSNHLHRPSVLYRNLGDGTFHPVQEYTIKVGDDDHSSAWGDYDNDGFPDLFSTSGVHQPDYLYHNAKGKGFEDMTGPLGVAHGSNGRGRSSVWSDLDNDGRLDLFVVNWITPNLLYLNQGHKMVESGEEQGLNSYRSEVGLAVSDWDLDGDVDLYLANHDRDAANKMYVNLGAGQFREASEESGAAIRGTHYHSTFADYDNDGDPDLVVTGNFGSSVSLLSNQENGTFVDVTAETGLGEVKCTHATWADFDNDGWQDLCLVLGGDRDRKGRPLLLMKNLGDGRFVDATREFGLDNLFQGVPESVAWADYNNDGHLDLAVTNGAGSVAPFGPHILYRNRGTDNHWLKIQLVGTRSNRDGVGARIVLRSGGTLQSREAVPYNGMAQNSSLLHFGLGRNEMADRIEVYWPSGVVQWVHAVPANRRVTVVESRQNEFLHSPLKLALNAEHRTACLRILDKLENLTSPVGSSLGLERDLGLLALMDAAQSNHLPEREVRTYYRDHQQRFTIPEMVWVEDFAMGKFHAYEPNMDQYDERISKARELLLEGRELLTIAREVGIRVWEMMWGNEPDRTVRGYISEGNMSRAMSLDRYGEMVTFYLFKAQPQQVLGPYALLEGLDVQEREKTSPILHLFRVGKKTTERPVPLREVRTDIRRYLQDRAGTIELGSGSLSPLGRWFYLPGSETTRDLLWMALEGEKLSIPHADQAKQLLARESGLNSALLDEVKESIGPMVDSEEVVPRENLIEIDHIHIANQKLADEVSEFLAQGASFDEASREFEIPLLWERAARKPASKQLFRMKSLFSEERLSHEFPFPKELERLKDLPLETGYVVLRNNGGAEFLRKLRVSSGRTEKRSKNWLRQRRLRQAWLDRAGELAPGLPTE